MLRAGAVALAAVVGCGSPDPGETPDAGPPTRLSETGLYADFAGRVPAAGLIRYAPQHALWADGADKERFLSLPPGAAIDTSDPDHWRFPVGTKLWKAFVQDGVEVETRLIWRTGPGDTDYFMGAFVWRADGSDADFVAAGADDIRATDHDAPAAAACWTCHTGEPGRILGVSAVQLPADALAALRPRLSSPIGAVFTPPGSPATAAALGYLHANCGHCHSEGGIARPDTDMILRLAVGEQTLADTAVCRTTFGVRTQRFRDVDLRVAPRDPDASAIFVRMSARGTAAAMPPLATEHVDPDGLAAIRSFISDSGCLTR